MCGMDHEEELLVLPPTKLLMPVLARLEREGCKGCIVVPKQPSLPFWNILQGGLVGEGIDVDGMDLQWSSGVRKRSQEFNTYYVSVFDFSARAPLNLQPVCAQVRKLRTPRPLTTEEQSAETQSVPGGSCGGAWPIPPTGWTWRSLRSGWGIRRSGCGGKKVAGESG